MSASDIVGNLQRVGKNVEFDGLQVMKAVTAEAEGWAKDNAPWTDRTGEARASIYGRGLKEGKDTIAGYIGIVVYYGVFLELAHQGKYRIVRPTLLMAKMYLQDKFSKIKFHK